MVGSKLKSCPHCTFLQICKLIYQNYPITDLARVKNNKHKNMQLNNK
jgi:hypothetical protein